MNRAKQNRVLSRVLLAGLLLLIFTPGVYAQNGERLDKIAVPPFVDNFLENSGAVFGGWFGMGVGGTGMKRVGGESGSASIGGSGGASIELRLSPYFGILTGVSGISDYVPYTPPSEDGQYARLSTLQIPVLARIILYPVFGWNKNGNTLPMVVFAGVGLNAAAWTSDAESVNPAKMNLIIGGEVGLNGRHFGLSMGYQFNGGIDSGSITVDGASYDYKSGSHVIYLGLRYYLPFC